ncbi:MAG: hypothetical protein A4S09_00940 [Proteobacteria bacterium SG_bin7]|nr:MAG: hypothetical protein A4S09_00940 [Proteobacteria bacterium SG_bin7]
MMKQFRIVAVALASVGLVSTALADGMEVTGNARFRMEQQTVGNGGQADQLALSTEVKMKWTPDPKLTIFFAPKFVKNAGAAAGTSGATTNTTLDVSQAYTMISPTDKISYTIGRYQMSYGEEVVIGSFNWNMVGRSFDGLKAHWTANDKFWLDVFYNKITEVAANLSAPGTNQADTNFVGLYGGTKMAGPVSEVDLYYLVRQDKAITTGKENEDRNHIGVRVKGAAGMFDYRAEYGTQGGKKLGADIKDADSTTAEVGVKFGDTRVGVEYFNANKNYDQLYPSANKFIAGVNLFGRSNINGIRGKVSHKFMEHFGAHVFYSTLSRTDAATAITNHAGTAYATAGSDKEIGSDITVVLTCNKIKNLGWEAGYSMFSAGKYGENITGVVEKNATYGYVMANASF